MVDAKELSVVCYLKRDVCGAVICKRSLFGFGGKTLGFLTSSFGECGVHIYNTSMNTNRIF